VTDAYRVEPISEERFPSLIPLMRDAFGDDVDVDFFRWKYFANPAGPVIGNIALAEGSSEVAAFYGMIPEVYRWGNDTLRLYQSCDTMTHSRHRRKGLFQKLALQTYVEGGAADANFCAIGFGGETSTPGFLKMKWRIEFEIPYLIKPRLLNFATRWRLGDACVVSDKVSDELVGLINENEARRPRSKVLDEAFIQWRLANPLHAYRYAVDPGNGYAIFYRSGSLIHVFDFWEASPGAGRRVMAALIEASGASGVRGCLTFCQPGSTFYDQLRRYGFLRNPLGRGPASSTIPFITYGSFPHGSGPDAWAITPFDHDSF
jgi:hypothetical protein